MFLEDLSTFINPAEFAQSVTVAGVSVSAIFDNGYAQASVGHMGMASSQPALTMATASVPSNWLGAAVVVAGQPAYQAVEHQPDGTGVSRLLLEQA